MPKRQLSCLKFAEAWLTSSKFSFNLKYKNGGTRNINQHKTYIVCSASCIASLVHPWFKGCTSKASWKQDAERADMIQGKKEHCQWERKKKNKRSIQVSVHYAHCVCFHSWRFWRDTLSHRMEYYRVKSWLASFCLRVNKVLWWQFSSSNLNINTHVLS